MFTATFRQRLGLRGLLLAGILALYGAVQWASVIHGAHHVSQDRTVPHALTCSFCVVGLETGGAPMAEIPAIQLLPLHSAAPEAPIRLRPGSSVVVRYRSRAPPTVG